MKGCKLTRAQAKQLLVGINDLVGQNFTPEERFDDYVWVGKNGKTNKSFCPDLAKALDRSVSRIYATLGETEVWATLKAHAKQRGWR